LQTVKHTVEAKLCKTCKQPWRLQFSMPIIPVPRKSHEFVLLLDVTNEAPWKLLGEVQ
jgi:hypothetical protein